MMLPAGWKTQVGVGVMVAVGVDVGDGVKVAVEVAVGTTTVGVGDAGTTSGLQPPATSRNATKNASFGVRIKRYSDPR